MIDIEEFYTKLADVLNNAPPGMSRWATDVLCMFEQEFEEELYPEDHE